MPFHNFVQLNHVSGALGVTRCPTEEVADFFILGQTSRITVHNRCFYVTHWTNIVANSEINNASSGQGNVSLHDKPMPPQHYF
ncbi:MAG: hypothetical protein AMXMBFR58_16370 [Phycisphaerae bacterium]